MRILLLAPGFYTLSKTIAAGINVLGHDCIHYDYRTELALHLETVNTQIFRMPFRIRRIWEEFFLKKINTSIMAVYEIENPDCVLIYNNEMLLPGTIQHFRNCGSKVITLMGDHPYYTPTNRFYLHNLINSDLIISPDSMWSEQIGLLSDVKIIDDFPGFNPSYLEFRELTTYEIEEYNSDVFFVGNGYVDAWGYKRAIFAAQFVCQKAIILGDKNWLRWLELFPELKKIFQLKQGRISETELIIRSKASKVYPVDANPGIINGTHLRIFDCIGMGILPVPEYRKDILAKFEGVYIPLVNKYSDYEKVINELLLNDSNRERILAELQQYALEKFSPDQVMRRVFNIL